MLALHQELPADLPEELPAAAPDAPADELRFDTLLHCIDSAVPTGACLVALWEGALVGSLGLHLKEPGGWVHSVFVAEDFRGLGIAEGLLRRAGEVAAAHGKPTLGLSVQATNAAAIRLYQRLGFRPHAWGRAAGAVQYVAVLPLG